MVLMSQREAYNRDSFTYYEYTQENNEVEENNILTS